MLVTSKIADRPTLNWKATNTPLVPVRTTNCTCPKVWPNTSHWFAGSLTWVIGWIQASTEKLLVPRELRQGIVTH